MDQAKGNSLLGEESSEQAFKPNRGGWPRVVAKIVLVPALLFFSLLIGLIIGYSVIGKSPVSEVFDLNTYKHMYDLIFAGT
ncbi:DNA-directed RNA polymerase subunit beta [Brevibacillus dissolubilis]|uniref:DNA-directed RNA polymerase subunit beta n=1 Tax=Brevibacillus dissolubilis TaxID=1844116 RepID=UPI0011161F9C|nr:DNA-directed RNA polymerase subunit beta [Brevibacillus dissolubilis]